MSEDDPWTETTSTGTGTGPPPDAVPRGRRFDAGRARDLLEHYIGAGMHGVLVNGTTGEWFSQTARGAPACGENAHRRRRRPRPGRHRLHRVHREPRSRRSRATRWTRARAAWPRRRRRTAKPLPDEIVAFSGHRPRRPDVPLMVYNWPHGTSVDIGPALADRLAGVDTVVAIKDSTPNARAVLRDRARPSSDRVRVIGPYMTQRRHRGAARTAATARSAGDRCSVPDAGVLGGALARRPRRPARARRPDRARSSRSSGSRAAGRASTAHYQSS